MGKKSKKGLSRAGKSKKRAAGKSVTRNVSRSRSGSFQKPTVQAPEATPEIASQPMSPTSAIELDNQTLSAAKEAPPTPLNSFSTKPEEKPVVLAEPELEIEPEPDTQVEDDASKESKVVVASPSPEPEIVSASVVPVAVADPPLSRKESSKMVEAKEEVAATQVSAPEQPVAVAKGLSLNEPSSSEAKESQKGCDCAGCVIL